MAPSQGSRALVVTLVAVVLLNGILAGASKFQYEGSGLTIDLDPSDPRIRSTSKGRQPENATSPSISKFRRSDAFLDSAFPSLTLEERQYGCYESGYPYDNACDPGTCCDVPGCCANTGLCADTTINQCCLYGFTCPISEVCCITNCCASGGECCSDGSCCGAGELCFVYLDTGDTFCDSGSGSGSGYTSSYIAYSTDYYTSTYYYTSTSDYYYIYTSTSSSSYSSYTPYPSFTYPSLSIPSIAGFTFTTPTFSITPPSFSASGGSGGLSGGGGQLAAAPTLAMADGAAAAAWVAVVAFIGGAMVLL